MTSVPKPFKFLKTYYKDIVDYFLTLAASTHRVQLKITVEKCCRFPVGAVHDLC